MGKSGPNVETSMRAVIVFMKSPIGGSHSAGDIKKKLQIDISPQAINAIYRRAIDRGLDVESQTFILKDEMVEEKQRTGRPTVCTSVSENAVRELISRDRYGREKTLDMLASDLQAAGIQISAASVGRLLKSAGFRKTKPTRKPGLTAAMERARLAWAKSYESWSIDDWKKVIFSDETSVVVGHRRGGYRIWRRPEERFLKSCTRERWKGYSDFMWWSCFSWHEKGPYHIWKAETAAEKKAATADLAARNILLEAPAREEWELNNGMRRMALRNLRGAKPKWRFKKEHGKLTRQGRGGIDWYRYQKEVLVAKLLPFAKKMKVKYGDVLVQEDGAPAHNHTSHVSLFEAFGIAKLPWPGNSPDLNAIEPCWPWMKRTTTSKGAPTTRLEAEKAWIKVWKDLTQEAIQAWVERIPTHIKEIIRLKGGNGYEEGRGKRPEHGSSFKAINNDKIDENGDLIEEEIVELIGRG
jgi:hypothetical protein